MTDVNETGANGRPEALESPGSLLKAARERQNLAIPDVARQLHLSAAKVEAIEHDNYDKLASNVFAQGYVRRYARLLQMNDDMVVQRFNAWVGHQQAEQEPELHQSAAASSSAAASKWLIPAVIFVAALAILVFIYMQTADDARGPVINDSPAAEEQGPEPEPAFEEPAVEDAEPSALPELRAVEPPAADVQRQEPAPAVPLPEAERTDPAAAAPAAPVENPFTNAAPETATDRTAGTADQDLLTFAFSSDCWVEVKNAQGAVIYADVAKGGESLILEGEAPFSIMLGNAEAASLTYNGELVPIPRRPGNRTSRLTVGE